MVWAIDVKDSALVERFAERFHLAGRRHELLIRPIGRTIYLLPPYLITPELAQWLAQQLRACIDDVLDTAPSLIPSSQPNADAARPSDPAVA